MIKYILFSFIFIFLFFGLYTFFIEPNILIVKKYTIKDEQLKGIKILFVSDYHIKTYQKNRLEKTIRLINKQNADIVLSTGDYVAGHSLKSTLPVDIIAEDISKIKSKYGYYTVMGNHDSWVGHGSIISALKKYSINILTNETVTVDINGKRVYIAGIEDLQTGKPDIIKALSKAKNPVILLTHNPDMFFDVPDNVNLILAGHTHGGQVRLPFTGALITPSMYGNRLTYGFINENNKKMIVTSGIGTSILPVRFNCRPEIVIVNFE